MLMHELYQRERHADFVREAEQDHITQEDDSASKPFYKPVLAAVGVKLVELGNRLQDNVETATTTPMLSAGKHAQRV